MGSVNRTSHVSATHTVPVGNGRARAEKAPPGPGLGRDTLALSSQSAIQRSVGSPTTPAPQAPDPGPITSSMDEALGLALAGKPVRLRPDGGRPRDLKVAKGDGDTYQISVDTDTFSLALPKGSTDKDLSPLLQSMASVPDEQLKAVRSVTFEPEPGHLRAVLAHADGSPFEAEMQREQIDGTSRRYAMKVGADSFQLDLQNVPDLPFALVQSAELYEEVPPNLRGLLKSVKIDAGPNPTDAYWAQTYGIANFKSGATGGNGSTTFWNGTQSLRSEFLHHEFGHVLGQHYSTKNELVPDDWAAAIASDTGTVSDYAKASPSEDFAETWMTYVRLKAGRTVSNEGAPKSLDEFRARFPKRAAIVEAIDSGARPMVTP